LASRFNRISAVLPTARAALLKVSSRTIAMLSTGHTVGEIGAQLKLASNTVSTYRARILEKTGTKNDVELALYGQRHSRSTPER